MMHTVLGSSWLPAWFLSALAPSLDGGLRVHWIDVGNRFDAYGLGRTARDLGLDPRRALSRVRIARPFNVFQLHAILRDKLPRVWDGEPVVISDPLAPFLDEDLPIEEAERMIPKVLDAMEELPAPWLILAVSRRTPPGRERLLEPFLYRCDRLVRLENADGPVSLDALELPWAAREAGIPELAHA